MTLSRSNSLTRLLCVVLITTVLVGGVVTATPSSAADRAADWASTAPAADESSSSTPAAELTLDVVESAGSTITVSLSTSAADTVAYAAGLEFDPDAATVESVDGADFDTPVSKVEGGRVTLTQSRISAEAADAPELARITFELEDGARTGLSFVEADTIVENADMEAVPVTTRGLTIGSDSESIGEPDTGEQQESADGPAESARDPADEAADETTTGSETDGESAAASGSQTGSDPADGADASNDTAVASDDAADSSGDDSIPGFAGSAGLLAVLAVLGLARMRIE